MNNLVVNIRHEMTCMRQIEKFVDMGSICELSYEEFYVFICIFLFFVFSFLDASTSIH